MTIIDTLRLIVPDGPIELRAYTDSMKVKRFESYEAAAGWARRADEYKAKAVYVVMNSFATVAGAGVTDAEITRRRWLLVDVDPTRPKDSNSTKSELAIAASTARVIEEYLSGLGWPSPVRALSGNGAHLLYRVDLPNDQASKSLVEAILKRLAGEFSSPQASVDTVVGNAARITKLYGTTARKGPHTDERPHRLSEIRVVPDPLVPVREDLLVAFAPIVAPKDKQIVLGSREGNAYDLSDVLSKVVVRRTYEESGSTYYAIACPWQHEHSSNVDDDGSMLFVAPDGALGFKCLHAHCANRNWQSVRDYLAIDTRAWKERKLPSSAVRAVERVKPNASRVTVGDRERRVELFARMDRYAQSGAMPGAIASGFKRLDGMLLGGFRPGKFYVLGGETGRGKTTLLLQWAITAASRVDVVGIVTPEMDPDSLDERVMSAQSGFGVSDYRADPRRGRENWEQAHVPQNIRASFDADDIDAFVKEEKPNLLIVDYAQQAVSYEIERRHTALAMLGAQCLEIAKTHQIPVLLGTQVNVTAERDFTVRETRILEHQADAMIFIDIKYGKNVDGDGKRQIESSSLLVAKNRHGYAGRVPIDWQASLFRFSEVGS